MVGCAMCFHLLFEKINFKIDEIMIFFADIGVKINIRLREKKFRLVASNVFIKKEH